jgi:hypothetical protein
MSLLHFLLIEKVNSVRDLIFMIDAYKGVFNCRKIASMVHQKQKKVLMCLLYSEIVEIKFIILDIDLQKLKNFCDKFLTKHNKI